MLRHFTLGYWIDDGWYVGRLREVPCVLARERPWMSWSKI